MIDRLRHFFTPGDWTRFEPSDRLLDSPLFALWPELGHRVLCTFTGHIDDSYGRCCWCPKILDREAVMCRCGHNNRLHIHTRGNYRGCWVWDCPCTRFTEFREDDIYDDGS